MFPVAYPGSRLVRLSEYSCLPVVLDPCSVLDDPASPSPKQTFRPTTTQPAQAPTQRLSPTTNKPRPLWIDAWICTPQLLTTPPGHTHVILSHSLHFIFRVGPHLTDFFNKDTSCVCYSVPGCSVVPSRAQQCRHFGTVQYLDETHLAMNS